MHPYTSMAVAGLTVLLAASSGHLPPEASLWRIGLSMLLIQFAIGTSNDMLDQRFDAFAKPSKPLPSGMVKPGLAAIMLGLQLLVAITMAALFGPAALGVLLFGLACGLSYNLGLKRTIYSWLPHALAAPTIIAWVWVLGGRPLLPVLWIYPFGLILGPALNLANQFVGAEAAAASGERSLVHFLGIVSARRLAAGLFFISALLLPLLALALGSGGKAVTISAVTGMILSLIFLILAERDQRLLLWPLALAIGGVLALGLLQGL